MKILSVSSIQHQMRLFELFLPDDIVFQILARLPLESLIRFRCVCKSWHKLLSDKYFIQLHNDLSPPTKQLILLLQYYAINRGEDHIMGLVDNWRRCYSGLSLDFLNEKVCVAASCYGLLCCVNCDTNPARYYICNPVTREFKIIFQESNAYEVVSLVVEPRSQRYHVVLDDPLDYNSIRSFVIFYSGTGELKTTLVSDLGECLVCFGVGRSIYRIVRLSPDITKLTAFDLYDEALRTMSPPFNLNDEVYLIELEGSLSVITISKKRLMDVWVLKDDKSEEWALVESIVISQVFAPSPIAINRDFVLLSSPSYIWLYCRRNKAWRKVHVRGKEDFMSWSWELAFRTTLCSC